MSVEVVIPSHPHNDSHRRRAEAYIVGLYREQHPDWTVTVAVGPAASWSKAAAVTPAVRASSAQTIVVADGDSWSPDTGACVDRALRANAWGQPHRWVRRLNREATAARYAGELPDWRKGHLDKREYVGFLGGGIVVIDRDVYLDCPLDPRFVGWGHEDESWAWALRTLHGSRWVSATGRLYHLWHPPAPRNGAHGAPESWRLRERYRQLQKDRRGMRALIEEIR